MPNVEEHGTPGKHAPRRAGRPRPRAAAIGPLLFLLLLAGCSPEQHEPEEVTFDFDRGSVFIDIAETMDGEPTETNIAELFLGRSFLQHGFHLAPEDEARYVIRGDLTSVYHQELTIELQGVATTLEHQWDSTMSITIADRGEGLAKKDDPEITTLAFPEPVRNGRTDEQKARRDIRRRVATLMVETIWRDPAFGDTEVVQLLSALVDPFEPRTFNEVELELIALGPRAVPYLLDGLRDTRTVGPEGIYPGLEDFNRDQLKVYHLADRMLADILERHAALDLLATNDRRFRVITGWVWAWEDAIDIPQEYRVRASDRASSVKDTVH